MAVNGAAICLGQTARSDESHRPRLVENQDGGALARQRARDRGYPELVDVVERGCTLQTRRELEKSRLLLRAPRQGIGRRTRGGRFVKAVDGPDEAAVFVFYGLDMHHRPNKRSIGPLDLAFGAADRNAGPQHARHRRLVAGNLPVVKITPERPAIFFAVVVETRSSSPQLGGMPVEPEHAALRVAGVNRHGQFFEELRGHVQSRSDATEWNQIPRPIGGELFETHLGSPSGARRARALGKNSATENDNKKRVPLWKVPGTAASGGGGVETRVLRAARPISLAAYGNTDRAVRHAADLDG